MAWRQYSCMGAREVSPAKCIELPRADGSALSRRKTTDLEHCQKEDIWPLARVLQLGKVNLEATKFGLCPLCLSVLCHRFCLRICLRLRLRLWLRLRLRLLLKLRLRLKQRPRRSSLRPARLLPQHGDCMVH